MRKKTHSGKSWCHSIIDKDINGPLCNQYWLYCFKMEELLKSLCTFEKMKKTCDKKEYIDICACVWLVC